MKKAMIGILTILLSISLIACGVSPTIAPTPQDIDISQVPDFTGEAYVVLNDNVPTFTEEELTTEPYEFYNELDALGRCGVVEACVGKELMPTEDRGSIGQVKPSGWHTVKYDFVDGKYLYNRCHLIGFQLCGENANVRNLITGTRYMNVEGMLPFENMVADYIKETDNHCMYRVTPVFQGDNLVASGVQIEALSVEDSGEGICFNVYCYNNQPGVEIDYATGESWLSQKTTSPPSDSGTTESFVLNTFSKKFHLPDCSSVADMKEENKKSYQGNRADLVNKGYKPCGSCNP